MHIAITGGTGFMGTHLADALLADGHDVVLIGRSADDLPARFEESEAAEGVAASVTDRERLDEAFAGCDGVAHLAGINMERGAATYDEVHVRGTQTVIDAAAGAGVERLVLSSFLRARPDCGSGYHESKWAAEEIVRDGPIDGTILKIGVTYGSGDHMVTHISQAVSTIPIFALIGFDETLVRPLAIDDLVEVLAAGVTTDRLAGTTVPVTGPEELTLRSAVERIGTAVGRTPRFVRLPVWAHSAMARVEERVMTTPLTARAQVRILSEGVVEPAPADVCTPLPADLRPDREFTPERIEAALPDRRRLGREDLRF